MRSTNDKSGKARASKIVPGLSGIQRQYRTIEDARDVKVAKRRLVEVEKHPERLIPLAKVKAEIEKPKKKHSEAVLRSRAKNPEAFRAYMREYMRKKRKAKK